MYLPRTYNMDKENPISCAAFGGSMRQEYWLFEPSNVNLNHGSFGAFPRPVREALRQYQDLMEANPDAFLRYDLPRLLSISRAAIASYVNVPTDEVVLVQNATTGINTVLRNLRYEPGDRILYFSTIYGSCEKTVSHIVETCPDIDTVRVQLKYPLSDASLLEHFNTAVKKTESGKIKVAIIDTVTSLPGVRMPFEQLVEQCKSYGILSLIDGAHGIGHLPLDLGKLDADFFVSNCHKYATNTFPYYVYEYKADSLLRWLYVPRGCAVLHVPKRNQAHIRTSFPTSHGFTPVIHPGSIPIPNPLPNSGKPPFIEMFDYVGTVDYSPYFCIPAALKFRAEVCGGEKNIMDYCTTVAWQGARIVANILGTEVLDNEQGSLTNQTCMVNVRLPLTLGKDIGEQHKGMVVSHISKELVDSHRTFIATVFHYDAWWARLCGQIYLALEDFQRGGELFARNMQQNKGRQ